MPVHKKQNSIPTPTVASVPSSSPELPKPENFYQYLRAEIRQAAQSVIQDTHEKGTPPRMKKCRIRRGDTSSKIVTALGPRASSKTD
jgi:hypothetical protein